MLSACERIQVYHFDVFDRSLPNTTKRTSNLLPSTKDSCESIEEPHPLHVLVVDWCSNPTPRTRDSIVNYLSRRRVFFSPFYLALTNSTSPSLNFILTWLPLQNGMLLEAPQRQYSVFFRYLLCCERVTTPFFAELRASLNAHTTLCPFASQGRFFQRQILPRFHIHDLTYRSWRRMSYKVRACARAP